MLSKKQTEHRNAILETLYTQGSKSRADLSRILDITPATMSELTNFLIKKGILCELGEEPLSHSAGRKKVLLGILPQKESYVGIELSKSKLIFCLSDNLGEVLAQKTIDFEIESISSLEDLLIESLQVFLSEHPSHPVKAIGLAVPGHYHAAEETIISNKDLWTSFDLKKITGAFEIPFYIKNNVKCMALGQLYFGQEQENLKFLFVNIKRGIFATYVYDNKIYADDNYLIGEIGHVVVNPTGDLCECGQVGCLQTYVSLSWILKRARHIYESGADTLLRHLVDDANKIKLSHVLKAYRMGDELLYPLLNQALEYLALQINNYSMILDLDAIYIHGKLLEDPSMVEKFERVSSRFSTVIQANRNLNLQVKPYEEIRGALGACALAVQKYFIHHQLPE